MSGWKKDTAEKATGMAEQQFAYQQKLINQREAERTAAMGQMESLMRNPPSYQIPAQVQQYTNLMNVLGGQLYGIQDASGGAKSIDTEQFRSQTEQVDQWQSGAGAFNPVIPTTDGGTGGGTTDPDGVNGEGSDRGPRPKFNNMMNDTPNLFKPTYRQPGDPSPTTQGRGGTTVPPVDPNKSKNKTGGRR